jgi:hypothetical protein
VFVLAAAAACKLSTDLAQIIAIEVVAPDSVEEFDTLVPRARVLSGHGDSLGVPVHWSSPDTTIRVDSLTGKTVVVLPGLTGRLLASAGGLVSNPLTIRTLAAADTMFPAGPTVDTTSIAGVTALDSLSDSLKVGIVDTTITGTGTSVVPLAGRPVVYRLLHPAAGAVTLVTNDTAHTLADSVAGVSNAQGVAAAKVRMLLPDTLPDSVVVLASARRAVGTTLAGSPATFVVRFRSVPVADTLVAVGPTEDTLHLSALPPDSSSDSLRVEVGDTATGSTTITPLAARPVVFTITSPTPPGPVTLTTSDTAHALVTTDTVLTDARGIAAVRLRLVGGPAPASVTVTAAAKRGVSARLPGSPVRFTVRFLP